MATPSRQIQSVSTTELYNSWAKVYDTDNNILQAIDDLLIPSLLTLGLKTAHSQLSHTSTSQSLTVTELGCGTGRNTAKLLLPPFTPSSQIPISTVNALDLSPAMLSIAQSRCSSIHSSTSPHNLSSIPQQPTLTFHPFNAFSPSLNPAVPPLYGTADLVLSTLVIEHLPLDVFFRTVRHLLKKEGGVLVLTNMHAEMGRRSQAGFMLEEGVKLQGESFVYEVEEVLEEGRRWGGTVVGEVGEREVRESDLERRVVDRGRGGKWVGCKVWFGVVMRFD
ncbi:hypothetical protein DL98DRAFT_567654 [Cadophora sp. DSE1049]|nr:hypothetical protein DL98DRAFT_567654 [Cadophora sp. DSE1049]